MITTQRPELPAGASISFAYDHGNFFWTDEEHAKLVNYLSAKNLNPQGASYGTVWNVADSKVPQYIFSPQNITQGPIPPELTDKLQAYFPNIQEHVSHYSSDENQYQDVLDKNRGDDLIGLPGLVNVPAYGPLWFSSHKELQDLAKDYMEQQGLAYAPPRDYAKVDPNVSRSIAYQYGQMKNDPKNPRVRASYNAFINETLAQYTHLINNGYTFDFYPEGEDPYPNSPRESTLDLHKNKHMYVYPTLESHDLSSTNDDPLTKDSGIRWGGHPVTYNDIFRAVHDTFGHAKEGVGMRANGEENAWRQHASMYSPNALPAMTSETRGQNSWVNFGPHGTKNRRADQADTVYAEQKTGILPEWTHRFADIMEPWEDWDEEYDESEFDDGVYEPREPVPTAEQGTPKFDVGESVVFKGYGDHGSVKSYWWSNQDNEWWYAVDRYDNQGYLDQVHEPESGLIRGSIGLDRGNQMDQPSAWTMKDFGIPPEAEDYFRNSGWKRSNDDIELHPVSDGEKYYGWEGKLRTFDSSYEGESLVGVNAWHGGDIIGSLIGSDEGDFIYIRTTFVDPAYQNSGIFARMFMDLVSKMGEKPAFGQWQEGNPLQNYFDKWNQRFSRWTKRRISDMIGDMQPTADLIDGQIKGSSASQTAISALTQAGGHVFVVGGAVRDAALGKSPKDIDLMVQGLDPETIQSTLSRLGRLDLTGKAFGVFRFKTGGDEVEIALPRTEMSTGSGHKDFAVNANPYLSPEEDLKRRDFTINAMAYHPESGQFLDPHNGMGDLKNGRLALVNERAFHDDPLRIVRALVATSRYGFEADPQLLKAMSDQAQMIRHLPAERIQMEMDKLMSGPNPVAAMQMAEQTGVLDYLAPELSAAVGFNQMNPHHELDVWEHTMQVLNTASRISNDPDVRLAALFHDSGKPDSFWRDTEAPEGGGGHFYKKVHPDGTTEGQDHQDVSAELVREWMNKMRYPKARVEKVEWLAQNHMFPYFDTEKGARKFLQNAGGDVKLAYDLLAIREADSSGKVDGTVNEYDRRKIDQAKQLLTTVLENSQAISVKDLAINGRDLMAMGYKAGPELGKILNNLLEQVMENPELNTRDNLLGLVNLDAE